MYPQKIWMFPQKVLIRTTVFALRKNASWEPTQHIKYTQQVNIQKKKKLKEEREEESKEKVWYYPHSIYWFIFNNVHQ